MYSTRMVRIDVYFETTMITSYVEAPVYDVRSMMMPAHASIQQLCSVSDSELIVGYRVDFWIIPGSISS